MELYPITQTPTGFEAHGLPDGVKLIPITETDDPRVRRLADLALHKIDLDFAAACLEELTRLSPDKWVAREALWRSAIVHCIKCFSPSDARSQIDKHKVLKDEQPEAMLVYEYFHALRNKHLVHDVNPYAQSIPGAVVNAGDKPFKIEKVVCLTPLVVTLEDGNLRNLTLLVDKARSWVTREFDSLCEVLTGVLEHQLHDTLMHRPALSFRVPTVDNVADNRREK